MIPLEEQIVETSHGRRASLQEIKELFEKNGRGLSGLIDILVEVGCDRSVVDYNLLTFKSKTYG